MPRQRTNWRTTPKSFKIFTFQMNLHIKWYKHWLTDVLRIWIARWKSRPFFFNAIIMQSTIDTSRQETYFWNQELGGLLEAETNQFPTKFITIVPSFKLDSLLSGWVFLTSQTAFLLKYVRAQNWRRVWLKALVRATNSKRRLMKRSKRRRRDSFHHTFTWTKRWLTAYSWSLQCS